MARIENASKAYTISRSWTPADGENIITILNNSTTSLVSDYPSLGSEFWANGHLLELRAIADFPSLPEAPLPEIDTITDNETSRLVKTLETKWSAPRLELNLWTSTKATIASSSDWDWAGAVSIQNSAGYPFTQHDLKRVLGNQLTADFGTNGKLGISLNKTTFAGIQYPMTASDRLAIRGSWRQEIFGVYQDVIPPGTVFTGTVQQLQQKYEEKLVTVTQGARATVFPTRTNRINAQIENTGTTNSLLVKENGLVTSSDYSYIITPGSQRLVTNNINGQVTAISQGGATSVRSTEVYEVTI